MWVPPAGDTLVSQLRTIKEESCLGLEGLHCGGFVHQHHLMRLVNYETYSFSDVNFPQQTK